MGKLMTQDRLGLLVTWSQGYPYRSLSCMGCDLYNSCISFVTGLCKNYNSWRDEINAIRFITVSSCKNKLLVKIQHVLDVLLRMIKNYLLKYKTYKNTGLLLFFYPTQNFLALKIVVVYSNYYRFGNILFSTNISNVYKAHYNPDCLLNFFVM